VKLRKLESKLCKKLPEERIGEINGQKEQIDGQGDRQKNDQS
jgi:hypothetical protein